MTARQILVTGATGQQGGAVARTLIARGHRVRGLTRNPDSPASQRLLRLGATMIRGAFDDARSLARALEGVESVFAMGTPYPTDPKTESQQGMALVDAAAEAGVTHFLYSAVAGADRATGVPHFDSKEFVEKYVVASGMPYTIVGPAFFMENLLAPWIFPGLQQGILKMPLPGHRRLQMTALADLGTFDALVLERRDPFLGKRIDIASDELAPSEAARLLSRVTGHPIQYRGQTLAVVRRSSEDRARMFEWLDRVGHGVDIATLRREYPQVGWHTFESWANTLDWSELEHPVARFG